MTPARGWFITFEGIEGSGKSTQLHRLAEVLRSGGRSVILTREPGGTALGSRLRDLLLDPPDPGIGPLAELFLYLADRAENIRGVVRPALAAGAVVLCDRHADATVVYQGMARGLGEGRTRDLNLLATGGVVPDLTFLFDLSVEEGLARVAARRESGRVADRMDREPLEFHRRIRAGYRELAAAEPGRFRVVDASGTPDQIHRRVLENLPDFGAA